MRGLDAAKVYGYLDLLADQVQATERELNESRAKNERLRPSCSAGGPSCNACRRSWTSTSRPATG